jgi:hypothetical protein
VISVPQALEWKIMSRERVFVKVTSCMYVVKSVGSGVKMGATEKL